MRARKHSQPQTHTSDPTHPPLAHIVAFVIAAWALALGRKALVAVWHVCWTVGLLLGEVGAIEEVPAGPAGAFKLEPWKFIR